MAAWPIPRDEDLRCAVLPGYGLLGSPPERAYDAITAAVAELLEVPTCLITVVGERSQWFKSRYGLGIEATSREASFCTHTIIADEPLVVPDALTDLRFRDNPLVLGSPYIRFYAGAPIITADGAHLGALCVIDRKPRSSIDLKLLTGMARVVAAMFDQRLDQQRVAGSRMERHSAYAAALGFSQLVKQLNIQFEVAILSDPALQILLELFLAQSEGRSTTLAECCASSGIAYSTGQRWIRRLADAGLVVQQPDPADRRRTHLKLTNIGNRGMAECLHPHDDQTERSRAGELVHGHSKH